MTGCQEKYGEENMIRLLIILLLILLGACSGLENTAGRVLDNARDAIQTGEDKVWMEPEEEEKSKDSNGMEWEDGGPEGERYY